MEAMNEETRIENQRKRQFKEMLVAVAKQFNDSPDFGDPEKLKHWCRYLYPEAEKVVPILAKLPVLFPRWPSVHDILKAVGIAPQTNIEIAKETAANIWAYMETAGTLTPLAERVFDSLGGWEKLGHIHFDYTSRRTYDLLFNKKALELITESQDNLLPKLPEPEPESKIDWSYAERKSGYKKGTEAFENWCTLEGKMNATNKHLYNREGHQLRITTEGYAERKAKAKAQGADFYEPPRSWEMPVGYEMTQEDHKMWKLKLKQAGLSL